MDFITRLPKVNRKTVILVVVDRLMKFCHLMALPTEYFACTVAKVFVYKVIKLHDIPQSILSDRDKVFTGRFRKEIHKLSGTTLKFSSAHHPQTDGQTEVVNRGIEMFLCSTITDEPRKWIEALPWVELWHNSTFNISIGMSPFLALYGQEAPILPSLSLVSSSVEAVSMDLQRRAHILDIIKRIYAS